MKRPIPNKLDRNGMNAILSMMNNPLIAFRLDRATEEHYHYIASILLIGHHAAKSVQRHRHLIPKLKPAFDALQAIFERTKEANTDTFIGTPEEVDEIETGVRIVEGLFRTTDGPRMWKAILRAQKDAMDFYS